MGARGSWGTLAATGLRDFFPDERRCRVKSKPTISTTFYKLLSMREFPFSSDKISTLISKRKMKRMRMEAEVTPTNPLEPTKMTNVPTQRASSFPRRWRFGGSRRRGESRWSRSVQHLPAAVHCYQTQYLSRVLLLFYINCKYNSLHA